MLAASGAGFAEPFKDASVSAHPHNAALNLMLPKRIDLFSGAKFKLGADDDSYAANFGSRFLFRATELRAAYTVPETRFDRRPAYRNPVFGLRVSLKEAAGIL